MRILGVETSCDETSVALLEVRRGIAEVKKEMTASQVLTHAKYGGVVPEVAARKHIEALPAIIRKLKIKRKDVDGIAVTRGPGLVTSLRVGTEFARTLAYAWEKPLVGINHIEGHIAANWIGHKVRGSAFGFPAIVLVVSGGHTEIILMKGFGKYERLGSTLDDAVGEAFDKAAKMLGLGYPGGPEISKRAEKGDPEAFDLPRPMLNQRNYNFSFSGLKTAVLYTVRRKKKWGRQAVNDLCASFQQAAVEVLVAKTARAAEERGARTMLLAGGVAANLALRETLCRAVGEDLCVLPDLKYCTDNAAMIAMAGHFHLTKKQKDDWKKFEPDPNWRLGD